MTLLNAAALLFALSLPVIVVLNMFRVRREPRVVPSLRLWERAVRDAQGDAWWRRLLRHLLLAVQLAAAAFVVLALARPALHGAHLTAPTVLIVIDNGPVSSARAEAGRGTVLEGLAGLAHQRIRALGRNEQAAIAVLGGRPRLVQPPVGAQETLHSAVRRIRWEGCASDPAAALEFARQLAGESPMAVFLLTPDTFAGDAWLSSTLALEWRRVAPDRRNAGITAADLLPNRDKPEQWDLTVVVAAAAGGAGSRLVEVRQEEQLVDSRRLEVAAGEVAVRTFPLTGLVPGALHVRLAGEDSLAADDEAFLVVQEEKPVAVTLLSAGNAALERALRASGAEVTVVAPGNYVRGGGRESVVVSDGPDAWARGSGVSRAVLGIGVRGGAADDGGRVAAGVPRVLRPRHPLIERAGWEQVRFAPLRPAVAPSDAAVLVETAAGPLLWERADGRVHEIVMTADLTESDLTRRATFPFFIAAAVRRLDLAGDASRAATVVLGQPILDDSAEFVSGQRLSRPAAFPAGLRVMRLDGAGVRGLIEGSEAMLPGWYYGQPEGARGYETEMRVGVSLADEEVTRLEARAPEGNLTLQAGTGGAAARATAWRELGWLAAALALGALLLEWHLYQRRGSGGGSWRRGEVRG